jgi:hypothetical protein
MYWNAQGYHQFAPSASLGVGLQFLRVGVVAEYQSNIARTFHKDGNGQSGIFEMPKISILRTAFLSKQYFKSVGLAQPNIGSIISNNHPVD